MQAFSVHTGIGESGCEEAPEDILLIQGPENIDIALTINGANVEIGSTIGVKTAIVDDEMFLDVITFDGNVLVEGVRVPVGYHTMLCLDDDNNVDCDPSTPQPVDNFGADWCILEDLPSSVLNYDIEILCPGEVVPIPVPRPPAQPAATEEPQATEELTAPDNPSQLADVDCSAFRYLGPFSNITPRPTLFTWTAAPGATDYELVFYNVSDAVVAGTFFTRETSIGVHVSQVPTGGTMALEVRAYRDGQYACVTPRTPPIMRSNDPETNSGSGQFNASLSCSNNDGAVVATIHWSGANPGDNVTASGQSISLRSGNTQISASGSGESGSVELKASNGISGISVSTSSGQSRGLGSCS
jgi:hypothetical protein